MKSILMSIKPIVYALQMAIEALKKAEKYKWHDLRKNPDDLPNINYKPVLVWLENAVDVAIWTTEYGFRPWYSAYFEDCTPEWESPVIAWREIEPFEEEQE